MLEQMPSAWVAIAEFKKTLGSYQRMEVEIIPDMNVMFAHILGLVTPPVA